jgi:tRNA-specific 2-thiouridylase
MLLRDPGSGGGAAAAAASAAAALGIGHSVVDLRAEFERMVVREFCDEYAAGRTPNPCVVCNAGIKFGLLLDWALAAGADLLATGHYARASRLPGGRLTLRTAADLHKDQTYFLYRLSQEQLARSLFPVGGLTKLEVRSIASSVALPVAERPESQDLCFVPRGGHQALVGTYHPRACIPGPVLDTTGKRIGTHRGIAFYTVGQRRGLGVAAGAPQYVLAIDPSRNALVVGPGSDSGRDSIYIVDCRWMAFPSPNYPLATEVKLRYAGRRVAATIHAGRTHDTAEVSLAAPQRAITPGQAAVFYAGDLLLGGGTIAPPEAAQLLI